MALTITAVNTTAIRTNAGKITELLFIGLGLDAGEKVATGVPHLWQNRAFSSSLAPQYRQ